LWLGPIWAALYYVLFRTLILRRNLKTPGREAEDVATGVRETGAQASFAGQLVAAFGGADNIVSLDACITRLRVELRDTGRARPDDLRRLGASGVVQVGTSLQAIFGTRSENLKTDIEEYLATEGVAVAVPADTVAAAPVSGAERVTVRDTQALRRALGGNDNIVAIEVAALTRLRVHVRDAAAIDVSAVESSGAGGVMRVAENVVHVIVGNGAERIAAELKQ
jgi:PTS system glucose-specific IIC component